MRIELQCRANFNIEPDPEDRVCPIDEVTAAIDPGPGAVPAQQPNILQIQFDDLGFGDWQLQDFGVARTPNLNRLARRGVVAKRYHTGATVCSPSRYTIATGRDSAEDGVFNTIFADDIADAAYNNIHGLPISMPTIYDELAQLGYKTGHFGKWHMGFDPSLMGTGVDETAYSIDSIRGFGFHESNIHDPADLALFQADPLLWYQTRDSLMAQETISFVNQHSGNDPWFVALSFAAPHTPLYPTAAGLAAVSHLDSGAIYQLDPSDPRELTDFQRYYAAIWDTDQLIGQILDELDALGETDNTIIVVTSDNGPLTNRNTSASTESEGRVGNHRGKKGTTYNGGLRVPFIVAGPTIAQGIELTTATMGAIDVMPTLIHLAGGTPPPSVDGEIMAARWQGQDYDRLTPMHWITIRNLPISMHVSDRSPNVRGYYPVGTVGNKEPWNVYTNTPDNPFTRDPEIYKNIEQGVDGLEMRNYFYEMEAIQDQCGTLKDDLINANLDWYASLGNPRLIAGSGRLTHEI